MNRTLVIIPTYNERENLELMVERVLRSVPDAELLIVDDNSPDGTGALAEDLASAESRLHVLHRPGKQGLGAAYQAGFRWGLDRGFEVLVEMDGDGSHRPEQLHRLLDGLDRADLVVGSRWVKGGEVENWPLRRMLLSRAGSLYARIALGLPFGDITGGYRAFRASALEAIGLSGVASQGYCFQIDMLWHAHQAGLRILEVPITFVERRFGVSKMDSGIVREAILRVTHWGIIGLPLVCCTPCGTSFTLRRQRVSRESKSAFLRELVSFGLVGGVGLVVDIVVFNALRTTVLSPDLVHEGPLLAKVISTTLAIACNWVGNRFWTYRDRRRSDVVREGIEFAVVSGAGMAIALGCLWISHYLMGYTSLLADNIATNVVGLALGTAFRFALYRWWVFGASRTKRAVDPELTDTPIAFERESA